MIMEKHIQKLLNAGGFSVYEIARVLLKQKQVSKNDDAFLVFSHFLFLSGLHRMLIEVSVERLEQQRVVSWKHLLAVIDPSQLSSGKRRAFLKGVKEQAKAEELLPLKLWSQYVPEMKNMADDALLKLEKKYKVDEVSALLRDLVYVESLGVLQKEEHLLKGLLKKAPKNPLVCYKWQTFREKKGRHFLKEKRRHVVKSICKAPPLHTHEAKTLGEFVESMNRVSQQNPQFCYDLALAFVFMGYPKNGAWILRQSLSSIPERWLYLELLVSSHQYPEALGMISAWEPQCSNKPSMAYALIYLKAQCYYGLGQKEKGKKLLSSIASVRPDYRLASQRLAQWGNEAS